MKENVGKILPIILLLSLIISAITSFADISDMNETLTYSLAAFLQIVETCGVAFLVYYMARNKKDSIVGIFGYLSIVVYIVVIIAYLIYVKNIDTSKLVFSSASISEYYDKIKVFTNVRTVVLAVIELLKYMCIIQLISENTHDNISYLAKMGSYLAVIVYAGLSIIVVFQKDSSETLLKVIELANQAFTMFMATFIIFQYINREESVVEPLPATSEQPTSPQPQASEGTFSAFGDPNKNKPRFRNPALEEQEARLAAEKAAKEATQSQQTPISNQQMVNQNMMNQPPIAGQQPTVYPQGGTVQQNTNGYAQQQYPNGMNQQ